MEALKIRTYSELSKLKTFAERYEYLKLTGVVGKETFGYDRYLNQALYCSAYWQRIRRQVILRDNACDLGIDGLEIKSHLIVHHMNPISVEDVLAHSEEILDPEYLICTTINTHNAIHYGHMEEEWKERKPGDTRLW